MRHLDMKILIRHETNGTFQEIQEHSVQNTPNNEFLNDEAKAQAIIFQFRLIVIEKNSKGTNSPHWYCCDNHSSELFSQFILSST